jgi:hypothetical protein
MSERACRATVVAQIKARSALEGGTANTRSNTKCVQTWQLLCLVIESSVPRSIGTKETTNCLHVVAEPGFDGWVFRVKKIDANV